MTLVATDSGGGDYELPKQGGALAICCQVIDLGTQESHWGAKHKVLLGWELPKQASQNNGGRPLLIWQRYTLSTNELAKLRQHLEGWRGRAFTPEEVKAFDLKNVLDKPCYLNIIHETNDGKTFANVSSIMPVPDEMKGSIPERINDLILFDIDRFAEPDMQKLFNTFREKLKETILNSVELKGENGKTATAGTDYQEHEPLTDDDIPF